MSQYNCLLKKVNKIFALGASLMLVTTAFCSLNLSQTNLINTTVNEDSLTDKSLINQAIFSLTAKNLWHLRADYKTFYQTFSYKENATSKINYRQWITMGIINKNPQSSNSLRRITSLFGWYGMGIYKIQNLVNKKLTTTYHVLIPFAKHNGLSAPLNLDLNSFSARFIKNNTVLSFDFHNQNIDVLINVPGNDPNKMSDRLPPITMNVTYKDDTNITTYRLLADDNFMGAVDLQIKDNNETTKETLTTNWTSFYQSNMLTPLRVANINGETQDFVYGFVYNNNQISNQQNWELLSFPL